MILFKQKKEPIAHVLYEMTKLIDSKITYNSIKEKLLTHPSFPYLFSITNTLTNFGIKNKAVRIKPEQLEQLNTPFLATSLSEETFLITDVKNNHISYFSASDDWKKMSLSEFTKSWTNMAILVETEKTVEEVDYTKKRTLERLLEFRTPLTLLFSIIVFLGILYSMNNFLVVCYLFCKISGLVVSLFLVKKEVNKNTQYSFCKIGSKLSCDEVLNSPVAKVFSWLSMTDLGFLYFLGTILTIMLSTLTIPTISEEILSVLIILSLSTLPYTMFSLIYQKFVLKKYCILCLGTIAILWIESILGYFYLSESSFEVTLGFKGGVNVLVCLALSIIFWMFFKEILVKSNKYDFLRFSNSRIMNNYDVFKIALQGQETVEMDFQPNEIVLGNEDAPNVLVVSINPYCPACGREFEAVLELLHKHPNFGKVVLRFAGDFHENDQLKLFTSAMLVSHYLNSKNEFGKLLKNWFDNGNLQSFVQVYPTEHNNASEKIIENHYLWSARSRIESTPTLFLNGKLFPSIYTLKQLIELLSMSARR